MLVFLQVRMLQLLSPPCPILPLLHNLQVNYPQEVTAEILARSSFELGEVAAWPTAWRHRSGSPWRALEEAAPALPPKGMPRIERSKAVGLSSNSRHPKIKQECDSLAKIKEYDDELRVFKMLGDS